MNGFNVANLMAPPEVFIDEGTFDWYEPERRTVHLSRYTAKHCTPEAIASATHECGHAIQHKLNGPVWRLRRAVSHIAFNVIAVAAVLLAVWFHWHRWEVAIGASIALIARVFVVLYIERQASKIALAWLELNGFKTAGMRPYLRMLERTYALCTLGIR